MKEKKPYIILQGEDCQVQLEIEYLNQLLKDTPKDEVSTPIEQEGKKLNFTIKKEDIRKWIKLSKTMLTNIVPNALNGYVEDISAKLSNAAKKVECREHEIEKIWFYLSQAESNNVFLVGRPDVGKTQLALEICRQIAVNSCPKEFYEKRVIRIIPERILKIESDFYYKKVIKKLVKFLKNNRNDIVIFIDNIIEMKMEVELIYIFYYLVKKFNIPFITTCRDEDFEKFFLQDDSISKYLNLVYIEEPEMEEIEPMVRWHVKKLKKKYGIGITDEMIKFTIYTSCLSDSISENPGKTINIFRKAFLEAKRKDKSVVDKKCILSCYDSYLKLYENMSGVEKEKTAYHEVGHYIVKKYCDNIDNQKIAFVSILPMMDFLGVTWSYIELGKNLHYSKEYLMDSIAISLAGRIAEKHVGEKDNTGASTDLMQANLIANSMITVYGMSDTFKNRSFLIDDGKLELSGLSDKKKDLIEKETQKIIDDATELASKIIIEKKELIDVIVKNLLEEEILTGEQLEKICSDFEESKNAKE